MRIRRRVVRLALIGMLLSVGLVPVEATPVARPANLPGPPVCTELVVNGGFELPGSWTIGPTPRPAGRTSENWYSWAWSMRLGIKAPTSDALSYSSVRQRVAIPAASSSATLSFWYWPATADYAHNDVQEALILDVNGRVLATVLRTLSNAQSWQYVSFDMTPFVGRTVDLYFNVLNNGVWSLPSWMYLDDVSLLTCGTRVSVSPQAGMGLLGGTTSVDIRIEAASGLYGAQVTLQFNPALLQVVDADPYTAGVQIQIGTFPDPSAGRGIVIARSADNTLGTITYAVSLQFPSAPVSGSGVLARVQFQGTALGTSALTFQSATLVDINGTTIPSGVANGTLQVVLGSGAITGRVIAQGRTDLSGTTVTAEGRPPVQTTWDGYFVLLDVPAGTYRLTAGRPGYLSSQLDGLDVPPLITAMVPTTLLRGGDADRDGTVGLPDLVIVGASFLSSPPADLRADLNGDGYVNVVDLVLVGGNFGLSSPRPWYPPFVMSEPASTSARVWVSPTLSQMQVGETRTVEIRVDDVEQLFGAEFELRFDPNRVTVIDANPSRSGVQIADGPFLVPEGGSNWWTYNQTDNLGGVIAYTVARISPQGPGEPVSGSGVLATVTFSAIQPGDAPLLLQGVDLQQMDAISIPHLDKNGGILIGHAYQVRLPAITRD